MIFVDQSFVPMIARDRIRNLEVSAIFVLGTSVKTAQPSETWQLSSGGGPFMKTFPETVSLNDRKNWHLACMQWLGFPALPTRSPTDLIF
jgi:hypothetical protein